LAKPTGSCGEALRHTQTFTGEEQIEEVGSFAWITGRSWKNSTPDRSDDLCLGGF
jgi:hypothetical protein